jgi:hypothetical protein
MTSKKKSNNWISHVKSFESDNEMDYKTAISCEQCKKEWKSNTIGAGLSSSSKPIIDQFDIDDQVIIKRQLKNRTQANKEARIRKLVIEDANEKASNDLEKEEKQRLIRIGRQKKNRII